MSTSPVGDVFIFMICKFDSCTDSGKPKDKKPKAPEGAEEEAGKENARGGLPRGKGSERRPKTDGTAPKREYERRSGTGR